MTGVKVQSMSANLTRCVGCVIQSTLPVSVSSKSNDKPKVLEMLHKGAVHDVRTIVKSKLAEAIGTELWRYDQPGFPSIVVDKV